MDNTIEIKMTGNGLSDKIKKLLKNTNRGLYERTEVVRLVYLALLSGESIFLLGPPGTAKSLLSRKMKNIIKDGSAFEYLMNPNTRQEELFGPIAISQLKHDKFVRVVENYIPDSDIVFLDEIWKSESSVLNSLLTIINEKIYKNGNEILNVPMKLLIAASNELPEEGVGLEALYDRFIIRYFVNNTSKKTSFESVILGNDTVQKVQNDLEKLTNQELKEFKVKTQKINVSKEILKFIHKLKYSIQNYVNEHNEEQNYTPPYISDRRWKKIIKLLRTSALADGRNNVEVSDLLVMPHVIWDTTEQKIITDKIFHNIWNKFYISSWWLNFIEHVNDLHTIVKKCKVVDLPIECRAHNSNAEIKVFKKFEITKINDKKAFPKHEFIWLEVVNNSILKSNNSKRAPQIVGNDTKVRLVDDYDFFLTNGSKKVTTLSRAKFNIEEPTPGEFVVHGIDANAGISFGLKTVFESKLNISDRHLDEIWKMSESFNSLDNREHNGDIVKVNPVLIDNYKQNAIRATKTYDKDLKTITTMFDEIKQVAGLQWL